MFAAQTQLQSGMLRTSSRASSSLSVTSHGWSLALWSDWPTYAADCSGRVKAAGMKLDFWSRFNLTCNHKSTAWLKVPQRLSRWRWLGNPGWVSRTRAKGLLKWCVYVPLRFASVWPAQPSAPVIFSSYESRSSWGVELLLWRYVQRTLGGRAQAFYVCVHVHFMICCYRDGEGEVSVGCLLSSASM